MTIRDLLTHRSGMGLGEGDLLVFPNTDYTRAQIIQKLRYLKPASSFRSKFAYDNLLYMVAGEIIPAVTGKSWDDAIRERLFKPLGMRDSNTSIADVAPGSNFASPHSLLDGKLTVLTPIRVDNIAPAGAINSSLSDMEKWIVSLLSSGAIDGTTQRVFSEAQSQEMWTPQTIVPVSDPPSVLADTRTNFAAYGLGWWVREYRGRKMIFHGGSLPGYGSQIVLIPEMKLGLVALTNQDFSGALTSIAYRILERYMGASDYDWVKAYAELDEKDRADAAELEKAQLAAKPATSKPSLPLEKYAGAYADPWYGAINIDFEQGKLVMRFSHTPALTGDMEHWQYDTFKVRWRDRSLGADAFATFSLNAEGGVREIAMKPVSPLTDFSFDFQDLTITPVEQKK